MNILETFFHYYHQNDPRTRDMFLISRPGTLIAIMLFYTYFCLSLGPTLMKNRKPFSLRKTLIVYNLMQVLASIYLVYEGLMAGWLYEYSFTCQPIDYSDSPSALRAARTSQLYFMCKLSELLDTVFFVLRKKDRQISSLHLYHHILMPLGSWVGVRYYFCNGHGTLFGVINSFVHIIMYGYYMLAALGPQVQKYLWWKKYLTLLQIVQFAIVLVHSGQTFFNDCNYPKILSVLLVIESTVFIYMFGSFYYENHIKKNVPKKISAGDLSDLRTSEKSD